jgi:hypothetical protein
MWSATFADRLSAAAVSDECPGAGRAVEDLFPFVGFAITMTLLLDETAGEQHAIPGHDPPCGVKDVVERRAVCRLPVKARQ